LSEIPMTSTLMTRLLGLKSGQAATGGEKISSGDKKPVSAQTLTTPSTTETTTIAVASLTQKAQNLQKLLDNLDLSITTLQMSRDAVNDVVSILEEAGGVTVRARDTLKTPAGFEGNKDRLAELEVKFTDILKRLDLAVSKSSSKGINLLKGDTLTTAFDADGKSTIATQGSDLTSAGLEFRTPDFSSAFKVQDSRIDVMNAIDIAITLRHQVTSDMMLIQTRQEFSANTIETLNAGATKIQFHDLGEEAANLLALQVRQFISETEVPLASEAQQHLLKQF
jgi:hypothetical protein